MTARIDVGIYVTAKPPFEVIDQWLDHQTLQIIRTAFTSRGPFHFLGEFFQLDGAVMDLLAPADRTPLIWVALHARG